MDVSSTVKRTLNGGTFILPIIMSTHPYCWKNIYVGIVPSIDEATYLTADGTHFDLVTFDCGGMYDSPKQCVIICPLPSYRIHMENNYFLLEQVPI